MQGERTIRDLVAAGIISRGPDTIQTLCVVFSGRLNLMQSYLFLVSGWLFGSRRLQQTSLRNLGRSEVCHRVSFMVMMASGLFQKVP